MWVCEKDIKRAQKPNNFSSLTFKIYFSECEISANTLVSENVKLECLHVVTESESGRQHILMASFVFRK